MTLFQVGTLVAFLQGIYESDYNFGQLAKKGNFGLGTLNAVDGEMVAVDGNFYRIDAMGKAAIIPPHACTPFAVVSQFTEVEPFVLNDVANMAELNKLLDSHIKTPNIFHMIRIDCEVEWIRLRSEHCQIKAYKPLAEALPKAQTKYKLTNSRGTLVVSRCPGYSASFTIPGYHYHYINEKRTTGGHVFDLKIKSARVMINPIRRFDMVLYDSPEFDQADLEVDILTALQKIE